MEPILQNLGIVSAIGLGAFAAGFLWMVAKRHKSIRLERDFPIGAAVRFKTATSLYRTRLAGFSGRKLCFEAPLSRDAYVPIQVGESVTVEAPSAGGILHFRGVVSKRDEKTHRFHVTPSEPVQRLERRDGLRILFPDPLLAEIDSEPARLVDASAKGARLRCSSRFQQGDRIRVNADRLGGELGAWIIESIPSGHAYEPFYEYRVIFEDLVRI